MNKTVTLIYPFRIKELDLKFNLQVLITMNPDNMDEFLDRVQNVGSYYGPNSYFTDTEISQLREIYENLCHQLETMNPFDKREKKLLKKQIDHFEKYLIRNEEGRISRWLFNDSNYPLFKRLEKVDKDAYKVLYYDT